MSKNKLIALAILVVLVALPFQTAFISFSVESQLLQVLTMAVTVIGSVVAIILFNKKGEGEGSHH